MIGYTMAKRASNSILPEVAVPTGKLILRWEALVALGAFVALYAHFGMGWGLFGLLFLVPDVSIAGYLWGPRIGALAYNAMHSEIGPLALGAIGLLAPSTLLGSLALIWLSHIAFDRALGYGLKSFAGFRYTHLGTIGDVRE